MKTVANVLAVGVVLAMTCALAVADDKAAETHWPQFRGTSAAGVALGQAPPVEWDVATSANVRWAVDVPGLGHSAPAIWGDRVFLTTAVGDADQVLKAGLYGDPASATDPARLSWKVLCLDKRSGKLLWERTARQGAPQIKRHPKGTHANPTCCTDGKRVLAFFGSEGLYCFDMDGVPQWQKDFGLLDSGAFMAPTYQWGFASSPVLHDGKVVILADVQEAQKKSFLAVLNAADGKEVWRIARTDLPTWGTPTVYQEPGGAGRTMIFVNGYREAAAYDFATGRRLWTIGGGGDVPVPTPIVAHGLVFLTSAHGPRSPVYAVRLTAEGDLTPNSRHVAWHVGQGGNYMQTPLVVGDYLYCCRDNGLLTCYEARTGKQMYRQRLEGIGFTASGVAAGNQLYFSGEDGRVHVVQAGPEFKLLATSALAEACLATPAISDGVIYFRTQKKLIAIGRKAD